MHTAVSPAPEKTGRSRALILSHLPPPFRFFGLLLLVIEPSFGTYLVVVRPAERVVLTFGSLMGGLFVVAALAVTLLTLKVPKSSGSQNENKTEKDFADQARRIKIAVKLVLRYSESNNKSPRALLDLLEKVEAVLISSKSQTRSTAKRSREVKE
jgi:hypothetical protein